MRFESGVFPSEFLKNHRKKIVFLKILLKVLFRFDLFVSAEFFIMALNSAHRKSQRRIQNHVLREKCSVNCSKKCSEK